MSTRFITNPYGDANNDGRVSQYDRVSSMITALVVLLGLASALMFMMWLGSLDWSKPLQNVVELLPGEEGEEKPLGEADDILEPGVEEFPEVETPQLADSIEALTEAASTVAASDREVDGSATQMGRGRGLGSKDGGGGGGGGKVRPPWERWQIRYTTASKEAYGKQLDFFKIEIGGISRTTPDIHYLTGMGSAMRHRVGNKSADKRVYFIYDQGVLRQWDMEFMQQAKVDMKNKILVQFYPEEVQAKLLQLERAKLGTKSLTTVYRTIYGVRQAGTGYEFYVIDQVYR